MQKFVILSCFFSLCLIGQEDSFGKNAALQKAQDQFLECLSSQGHNNDGTCKAEYDSLINSIFCVEKIKTCDQPDMCMKVQADNSQEYYQQDENSLLQSGHVESLNIKKEKKHPEGCLLFFKQISFLSKNLFLNYLLCSSK